MFRVGKQRTIISEGFSIVGSVTSDGLLEVYGKVEGAMHCASLVIHRHGHIVGPINGDKVVVDGTVRGPIDCGEVILNSRAKVVGDIRCRTLVVEKGAFIEGNLRRMPEVKVLNQAVPTPAWT